ncbi:MAG TPA: 50S ribosomal protein L10 [Thermoleophilaceae bacterium]|nr:50S ribosomal protein L10 [Thermoleophilaceae bacterium]
MNRDQKAAVIDEVASQIEEAHAIFAVDYRGLTVRQAADLRGRLIEIDANLRVVKNTLTERAADQAGAEPLKAFLEGPTAFTFVKGDPVLAAKAIAAFRREAAQLPAFKGGWMDGKELSIEDIETLSRLPSLDVMHGQLVGMIASPLSGLVRSLNALLSGIAVALGQIQEQGLVGGDAPAVEEAPAADAESPAAAPAGAASDEAAETTDGDDAAAPADTASDEATETTAHDGDEEAAAEAAAPAADATSDEVAEPPAHDGDEGAAAEAAAPAADAEPTADAAADDAPAADSVAEPAAAEADSPAADAAAAEGDSPAADEPDNQTSTEEGDN